MCARGLTADAWRHADYLPANSVTQTVREESTVILWAAGTLIMGSSHADLFLPKSGAAHDSFYFNVHQSAGEHHVKLYLKTLRNVQL